jgi:hypothetical protein
MEEKFIQMVHKGFVNPQELQGGTSNINWKRFQDFAAACGLTTDEVNRCLSVGNLRPDVVLEKCRIAIVQSLFEA